MIGYDMSGVRKVREICGKLHFLDRDKYAKIKRYTCNTYNMQYLPIHIQIEQYRVTT